jgi:hypothetical protein
MDSLKAAQMHQLLMDLLSLQAVENIFKAISSQAHCNQMMLLILQPSDSFQVKVSYYVEPENVKLFIRVPMATTDSLLHIHKFHPFLLPFTDTHSLIHPPHSLHQSQPSQLC